MLVGGLGVCLRQVSPGKRIEKAGGGQKAAPHKNGQVDDVLTCLRPATLWRQASIGRIQRGMGERPGRSGVLPILTHSEGYYHMLQGILAHHLDRPV
jgi:hypothetical protein